MTKSPSSVTTACRVVLRSALWTVLASGALSAQAVAPSSSATSGQVATAEELNQRLQRLRHSLSPGPNARDQAVDLIGPEDLLEIAVFEAPELNRVVRVSATGDVSLPLIGTLFVADRTPRQLEAQLQEVLRQRYIKDPHVSVFVREIQSHSVSVFGAVRKPGVYQIRSPKTLIEVLSMAEGLAEDAGDTVVVLRGTTAPSAPSDLAGRTTNPAKTQSLVPGGAGDEPGQALGSDRTIELSIKDLLFSGEDRVHVTVFPGDTVKVPRGGIVYVVGEVKKPGGFLLKSNENISVLQAIALAEGVTRTSAKEHTRIIRNESGTSERIELPVDLGKVFAGKAADVTLRPNDIVFVPNSAARSTFYRGAEAAVSIVSGLIVFRR